MNRILVVFLTLFATPAFAGGISWSFTVDAFDHDPTSQKTTIVLRPEKPRAAFPESCALLRVTIRLEREPFWRRTWSREQVTAAKHVEAIEALRQAALTRVIIRFGSMGTGLVPAGSDPCSMRSKGLAVLEEHSGEKGIYSFHDPI
jgi:hypothetical protein